MEDEKFDIIAYIAGLTDYTISRSVATNIAQDRGVLAIEKYEDLTQENKDLLKADVISSLLLRPRKTASVSKSHSGFSVSYGSEELGNVRYLTHIAKTLYEKWGEEVPFDTGGELQWL